MSIFRETFKQHIIDELEDRKNNLPTQEILYPKVRVTSLIKSSGDFKLNGLNVDRIMGFTLGTPDIGGELSTLDAIANVNNKGTIVGITYTGPNGSGVPVYITPDYTKSTATKKRNLPSPGVTNVSISTQSKGGLLFKATVNFKFYGKEQYDIIYQTFMRPGNPVLIEYGHTMSSASRFPTRELKFFRNLTQEKILEFQNDLIQSKPLVKYKNGGAVTGLVSNFKISLNENNEYEAQVDLINSLEYLFAMPTEDTFLNYKMDTDNSITETIETVFGHYKNNTYKPWLDSVLQTVLNDNVGLRKSASNQNELVGLFYKSIISPLNTGTEAYIFRRLTTPRPEDLYVEGGSADERDDRYLQQANEDLDLVYISLDYFLERLLPLILGNSSPHRINYCSRQRAEGLDPNKPSKLANLEIIIGDIGHWPTLRSINVEELIINNSYLYDPAAAQARANQITAATAVAPKFRNRIEVYKKQFGEPENSKIYQHFWKFFDPVSKWSPSAVKPKEVYPTRANLTHEDIQAHQRGEKIEKLTTLEGIFISYQKIRNAFIGSSSVSEALAKILKLVSINTNNILNLKMRVLETDQDGNEDKFVIYIYDENVLPKKDEVNVYTFFENDLSEALSYNFDFSLPSSVSSTIIANKFKQNEDEILGDGQTHQIIKNGYLIDDEGKDVLISMIDDFGIRNISENEQSYRCRPEEQSKDPSQILEDYNTFIDGLEGNKFRQTLLAYREFTPQFMKEEIITINDNNDISLFNTLPTSAKISIKLTGLDGFRFGDMFSVRNMLPYPYDENNIFMLTGYKHDINSDGWITTIDGIMIATTPSEKLPRSNSTNYSTPTPQSFTEYLFTSDDVIGVVESGTEYIILRYKNGSVITRRNGTRSWRNNNPGNLKNTPFSVSAGSIGSDNGGFAVFPNYTVGRRAQEKLLFESGPYINLTLSEAINRYAPPNENDTLRYIGVIKNATGVDSNITKMGEFTRNVRIQILNAMQRHEGFEIGTSTVR